MKKLIFPFVEIEVPDDFPDGLDIEATGKYADKHPGLADKIIQKYRKAYYEWVRNKDNENAQTTCQPKKAEA